MDRGWNGMRRFYPDTAIRRETCKDDLSQFTEEKPEPFPINTVFVPKQLLANVLQAGKEFCLGAKNLNPTTKDSAIGKGIQMIARQTQEVFADCHDGDTNIRVSTWIEKLLAVKDNLEYGIVSSERTTNRWAYMDEKLLMMISVQLWRRIYTS